MNKPISYKKATLAGFNVHSLDIKQMFAKAGLDKDKVLRCIVQPDTHVPEQDKKALRCFNLFVKDFKPHIYINLGDFLENEPSSHWPANSAKIKRLVPEIIQAKEALSETLAMAGRQCTNRIFIMGNHEEWTKQLLIAKVPELYDGIEKLDIDLSLTNMLNLNTLGFKVIPFNEILKVGFAHFIHGIYTSTHHAKKHVDVFGVNTYYGHLHDQQLFSRVSVDGLMEAASLGCLRTLNAAFLKGRPSNWVHSFGVFYFFYDGTYTRTMPIIVNGKLCFEGKIYDASSA